AVLRLPGVAARVTAGRQDVAAAAIDAAAATALAGFWRALRVAADGGGWAGRRRGLLPAGVEISQSNGDVRLNVHIFGRDAPDVRVAVHSDLAIGRIDRARE